MIDIMAAIFVLILFVILFGHMFWALIAHVLLWRLNERNYREGNDIIFPD